MKSVYIETTIPSFFFETRKDPTLQAWREFTRHWWNDHRQRYRLFSSKYVVAELSRAPLAKSRAAVGLLKSVEMLEDPPTLFDVVDHYVDHMLMPKSATGDAVHLALASLCSIDFLLTWNCNHLANANKTQHLAVLNGRLGLHVPIITTPMNLKDGAVL